MTPAPEPPARLDNVAPPEPDWARLHQALTVEVDRNFNDVQGKQFRFSEFLALQLEHPPSHWHLNDREKGRPCGSVFGGMKN